MRFSILRLARGPLSSRPMRTGSMPMRMRSPRWPAERPACPCPRGCGMSSSPGRRDSFARPPRRRARAPGWRRPLIQKQIFARGWGRSAAPSRYSDRTISPWLSTVSQAVISPPRLRQGTRSSPRRIRVIPGPPGCWPSRLTPPWKTRACLRRRCRCSTDSVMRMESFSSPIRRLAARAIPAPAPPASP